MSEVTEEINGITHTRHVISNLRVKAVPIPATPSSWGGALYTKDGTRVDLCPHVHPYEGDARDCAIERRRLRAHVTEP